MKIYKLNHVQIGLSTLFLIFCVLRWSAVTAQEVTCRPNQFRCNTGRCINDNRRCNLVWDCPNGEDEKDCPCSSDEFTCDNGHCVDMRKVCDGLSDCSDGSDEYNCPTEQACVDNQFKCLFSHECINATLKCNGINDCVDESDEYNCMPCRPPDYQCASGQCIPYESGVDVHCNGQCNCWDCSDEKKCSCKPGFFKCHDNSTCLPPRQRCDGVYNCNDMSDEANCTKSGCHPDQFQCADGEQCVNKRLKCDGNFDCNDGSDERNCDTACSSDQFKCDDGQCLNIAQRCDRIPDCRNGEDEHHCANSCPTNEFSCADGECIHASLRCDGTRHCRDGSDESNCDSNGNLVCYGDTWKCTSVARCIANSLRNDGKIDCPDGSDEEYSIYEKSSKLRELAICNATQFQCHDGKCINSEYRCDSIPDCDDGSDESDCDDEDDDDDDLDEPLQCTKDQFACGDGTCIPLEMRCNNVFDCENDEDEEGCGKCTPYQFACDDGECIDESRRCDNISDCRDYSDEANCVTRCRDDDFQCSDGLCLDNRRRCDGYDDCRDASDERDCPRETTTTTRTVSSCRPDQFRCNDGTCISSQLLCNGYADCVDYSDEGNCTKKCDLDQFTCADKSCISLYQRCDGYPNCPDGDDELDCASLATCGSNDFTCNDGSCVPHYRKCDGRPDCSDSSDELNCCQPDEFRCGSGECIPIYEKCDDRYNCQDRSDEQHCDYTTSRPRCRPGEFQCRSGECIPSSYVCNDRSDCRDVSDEENCTPDYRGCLHGQFRCENGPCIDEYLRCDGKVDCPYDTSDELDCYQRRNPEGLDLKTYPDDQIIKERREVVFQCRDEGPLRAHVHWVRANGQPLPPGSRDNNGRLEMPNIQVAHSGSYTCEADGYSASTPGSRKTVYLTVEPHVLPPTRPPKACHYNEATCSNGDCIPKSQVCDGQFDCTDGSDEMRCSTGCEPNEFHCQNKKCVLKTWRCDGDDDCGDGSDELNCATNPPGSPCLHHEFQCHTGNQCIPRSFHCDTRPDCLDNSDEIGCIAPHISVAPPPMVTLDVGELFKVNCTAVGVPTPEIVWRLNWGHVPPKCTYTSHEGYGVLTCPNIQEEDQGAYSCEALNSRGLIIAVPDAILVVKRPDAQICPRGFFNDDARYPSECISCFCFGASTECHSADLFTYQLPPPFDVHKLVGVRFDQNGVEVRDEPIYRGQQPQLNSVDRYGVHAVLAYGDLTQSNLSPYYALPENYHGNQLKSYGGYLKYTIKYEGRGRPNRHPEVIITGNGYTLVHDGSPLEAGREHNQAVRLFAGEWHKHSRGSAPTLASRAEIMMTLHSVDNILIKMVYVDGPSLDSTITNLQMDSAAIRNTGQGRAAYVEECQCPVGYGGLSCEQCAPGYKRHESGPWLGKCYQEEEVSCKPGTYGDPSRGIPCQTCPCPLTSPSNQFARTCSLRGDGQVQCDCPPGYVGLRCEQCDSGYTGNPLIPGDSCKPGLCNAIGSLQSQPDASGNCVCKSGVTGSSCDKCKANSFYLSPDNQFGCIDCFCMGITRSCTSSNWYRDQIQTVFTSSKQGFRIVESLKKSEPLEDGIRLNQERREITYDEFSRRRPDVYYWSLPSRYLGDKITSYGGFLNYTLRYVPVPGGLSSRNTAADVELISVNDIRLLYFSKEQPQPNSPQSFSVPILEQYWQRSDGQTADREHLLMTLADLEAVLIKATYTTNTREASLISVSLDIADEQNRGGLSRAYPVEQCFCPPEYRGLSCEDCAVGYTRASEGLYLGLCEPCQCNGHSNECDPETGVCQNCRDHTTGDYCDECLPGYVGTPSTGCLPPGDNQVCECDSSGSISTACNYGECECKANVEGSRCDKCRPGTFALSRTNPEGCTSCFCLGVTDQCHNSNLYIEQIPVQIIDESHGFTMTDLNRRETVQADFDLNPAKNEIGYIFPYGSNNRLYWSLPQAFTGNHVKSYGGSLAYTLRYENRAGGEISPDQDVVIIGNGITIYWTNNLGTPEPDTINKISVSIATTSEWQRLDYRSAPRPASREDILTVLSNVEAILIRASPSTNAHSSHISDITLDTAVAQYTGNNKAVLVEMCKCPVGYRGSSCELCSPGYYRDEYDRQGTLGACKKCPCNGNAAGCYLSPERDVVCNCIEGYHGENCDQTEDPTVIPPHPTVRPPPNQPTIVVTISEPSIKIVDVGGSVRFQCTGRSKLNAGPVTVHWIKLNGELPRDRAIDDHQGLLVITDVRVSDTGTYVCQARDGYHIVEDKATLNVGAFSEKAINAPGSPATAPRVTISPTYLDISEGQPAEFRCQASGNPAPNMQWSREGGELNPRHNFRDGIFRIPQVSKDDEGQYRCTATNSAGTDELTTVIYVREAPPGPYQELTVRPSEVNKPPGEQFILTCVAPAGNRVQWSKYPGVISPASHQDETSLTIYNARIEDSGNYTCTIITNSGTSGKSSSARVIIATGTVSPTTHLNPERQTVSQGDTAEVRCIVSGEPIPIIKWTKVGEEFSSNTQQIGDTLRIFNAQVRDRGAYVCVAENEAGISQVTAIIEVDRREPPSVELYPDSRQVVTEGSGCLLQCRVSAGIPSPTITWSRHGSKSLPQKVEELPGGVLRFHSISRDSAGEYICTAENDAGRTTATAIIEVQTLPIVNIIPQGPSVTIREGDRLSLECRVDGTPLPTASWIKHQPKEQGYRNVMKSMETPSRATFEIANVNQDDEGYYSCFGKNAAGSTEERIQVIIESNDVDNTLPTRGDITGEDGGAGSPDYRNPIPRRPGDIDDEDFRVPVGGTAELRCRVQQKPVNYRITFQWVRTDRQQLSANSINNNGVLYINDVQKSDEGEYSCMGISPDGDVLFTAQAQLTVIEPPHIVLNPKSQIKRPGEDAYILCTATGDQPIQIQWSAINRELPRSAYTRGGELRFRGIAISDAGKYRCSARSHAGEADAVAEVIVNEQVSIPRISAVSRNEQATVGSTVKLRCDVSGLSGNTGRITWSRERLSLPSNAVVSGNDLRLENIQPQHEGRYICKVSNEAGEASDYINVIVNRPTYPASSENEIQRLKIEPSLSRTRLGDTLDLRCTGSHPGSEIFWTRPGERLPANSQASGPLLRITNIDYNNAGVYRCESQDSSGIYSVDYTLDVEQSPYENEIDERNKEPEVKTAPRGSTVKMDCLTDLESPVTFEWNKQNGILKKSSTTQDSTLTVPNVVGADAGTYICTASNKHTTMVIPMILVVTGIVPYFAQAPSSYLSFKPLPDSYLNFSIEISFKPETNDGLILYNGNHKHTPDFVSLSLVDGIPEFRYNLGVGTAVIKGDRPLRVGEWHTVKITRARRNGYMYIDGQGPYQGVSAGKHSGLDLSEPMFVGGVPRFDDMAPDSGPRIGFVGCISRLVISRVDYDLIGEAHETQGVTTCETCATSACQNRGTCQEAATKEGYSCICPAGFSGLTCERTGESCYPGACGTGRCVNRENGYDCYCPMFKTGPRCERDINISEPAFADDAYIAYPPLKPSRRLKMALRFNPASLKDGILFYCGESDEGDGDFTSLAIRDKHLEFTFDSGSGPVVVRSDHPLVPGEWLTVSATKVGSEAKLMVNGDAPKSATASISKMMNLHTPLYVGGFDKERITLNRNVGVNSGFEGCISGIEVLGTDLDVITSAKESANVQDCSDFHGSSHNNVNRHNYDNSSYGTHNERPRTRPTPISPCSGQPCKNDGTCYPISPVDYSCACTNGFTGRHCENAPDLCESLRPCQNGGTCSGTTTTYKCDCPLGYMGAKCDEQADIATEVSFSGDGYLELSSDLLSVQRSDQTQQIALAFSTNSSDGLILWYGQDPDVDGRNHDFIAVAVVGGFLEFSWNLGSGSASITNKHLRVDDGRRHTAILKRMGHYGSLEPDSGEVLFSESSGVTSILNSAGNIYLGGTPNLRLMTGGKYTHGFDGCIHQLELQDDPPLDFGAKALSGVNSKTCTSSPDDADDISNDLTGDNLVN